MEIRSLSVIRFAKDIPFTKQKGRALPPQYFEDKIISSAKTRCLEYLGIIGEWKGNKTYVLFKCHKGHLFYNKISAFLIGKGCRKCADILNSKRLRYSEKDALLMSNQIAAERGRGEIVVGFSGGYQGNDVKNLIIECPHHGQYITRFGDFKQGYGCASCAGNAKLTTESATRIVMDFAIERGLGEVIIGFDGGYKKYNTRNLRVLCPVHGEWLVSYDNYMRGRGCASCADHGFQFNKPGYVYIQKITGVVSAGKIGITNKTPEERMAKHKRLSKLNHEIVFSHYFEDGNKVWEIERLVKSTLKDKMRFVPRELMQDGFSETFPIELLTPVLNEVKSICCK
ncbi:hypothetical protein QPC82_003933 [Escherichia coli]|nr:hypothetical protein [Escherichia coli]